jgi:stage V sporulation protein B
VNSSHAGSAGDLAQRVVVLTGVRVLSMAAGAATALVGSRLIGPEGIGVAATALTLSTLATLLANLGLTQSTIFFLGRSDSGSGPTPALLGQLASLALISALGTAALGGVLAVLFAGEVAHLPIMATVFLAGAMALFEFGGGFLLGLHLSGGYAAVQMLEASASLILTVFLLSGPARSPEGFVVAAGLGYQLALLGSLLLIRRTAGRFELHWQVEGIRPILGFGMRGQIGNILQFVNLRMDLLLVALFLDAWHAGLYFAAVRSSEAVMLIANSAATLLFPAVSSLRGERAWPIVERTARSVSIVMLGGVAALVVGAEPLLAIAFGTSFESAAPALRVMALAMLPLAVARVLGGAMKGLGRPGLVSAAVLVGAVTTAIADVLLIPLAGITGAACASMLAYSVTAAAMVCGYRAVTGRPVTALMPTLADVIDMWKAAGGMYRRRAIQRR